MKAVLDLHDFSIAHNRFDVLFRLKEHFPDFKVSLFTVPIDFHQKRDWGPTLIHKDNVEELKKHLSWMQLIPHGVCHESSREMEFYNKDSFINVALPRIKEAFKKDDLPFEKGFCAPHWRWSKGVVQALDELGWWGAILREDRYPKTKRFYRYTHLLNEPFWESDLGVIKLHGHVYGTKNDVGRCFDNLLKLPKDTQWEYVTNYIEQ